MISVRMKCTRKFLKALSDAPGFPVIPIFDIKFGLLVPNPISNIFNFESVFNLFNIYE